MFRKRPYFLKKKEWYVKTELAGTETYIEEYTDGEE